VDSPTLGIGLDMVLIFGKDTCPYTQNARDHYAEAKIPFEYVNVKKNTADLARMLTYSKGARRVPVIVDQGEVTIGFGGT
jgi:glutaredoxin 3